MAEITADILSTNSAPALSATSDMPTGEPATAPTPEPAAPEPAAEPQPEPDTPEPEAEPVAEPDATPEPQKGIQRRFSELTAEKKVEAAKREAAEEHARRLEALLAEALANKPPVQETKPPEPPAPEPVQRPRRENFVDPDAYEAAMDAYYEARIEARISRERAEREQHEKAEREAAEREQQNKQAEQSAEQVRTAFNERRAKFMETHEDFEELVTRDDLRITTPMAMAIMTEETGPAIAYHLAQHPEEAARIAALPDAPRQVLEIGKLAARLEGGAPAVRPPPPPPAPMAPVRRGTGPAVTRSINEIGDDPSGMAEYAAKRLPELQAERRPGGRVN